MSESNWLKDFLVLIFKAAGEVELKSEPEKRYPLNWSEPESEEPVLYCADSEDLF